MAENDIPRYIVKNAPEQPGFWYVWDNDLDSLETSFRTIEQAAYWAERLNNDPTVAHFRRPLPLASTFEVQASTAYDEDWSAESWADEDPTAGFTYPIDR